MDRCDYPSRTHLTHVVVGAGAMGMFAARTLRHQGHQVCLLDSGPGAPERGASHRFDAPSTLGLTDALGLGVGGTTRWWGGQCVLPPATDLEAEPGRGDLAWPVEPREFLSWGDRVLPELGLTPGVMEAAESCTARRMAGITGFDALASVYMRRHRLDREWAPALAADPDCQILSGMRVIALRPSGDGVDVVARCVAGHEHTVNARKVVLASGALANAEVLLRSRRLGLDVSPACGRYLSEHLTVRVARVSTKSARRLALGMGTNYIGRTRYWPKLALAVAQRRAQSLPAVAVDLHVEYEPRVARARERLSTRHGSARRLGFDRLGMARAAMGAALARVQGSAVDFGAIRSFELQLNLEQPPRVRNTVELHGDEDRPRVAWEIADADCQAIRRITDLLLDGWSSSFGTATSLLHAGEELRERIRPQFHHSGTTRMGRRPADSVVDPLQRLHSDHRVLVIGTSTFPTAGWVNPTLLAWTGAARALANWR